MKIAVLSRGGVPGLRWGLEQAGNQIKNLDQAEAGLLSLERRPGSRLLKARFRSTQNGQEVIRAFQCTEAEARGLPGFTGSTLAYSSREMLAEELKGWDQVLLCKGTFMTLDDIAWLAQRFELTYLMWDTVTCGPPNRVRNHGERGALCHSVITTGAESAAWFRARRPEQRVVQIYQGFRPSIWQPAPEAVPARRREVLFTGALYSGDGGRKGKLDLLRGARLPVVHINHDQGVFFEKAALRYSQAAITLNFVPQQSPGSFSNRVVRVLASGGFLLSEWCEDLGRVFRDGEELVLFRNDAEMVALAGRLLGDEEERRRIREQGLARVQEFSWDRQAEKYLRFLTGEEVTDDGQR
jgi:hypothetical protein